MSDEKVPMTPECLRMVPLYARVEWHDEKGETSMPVGQMCHQAADSLESLSAEVRASEQLCIQFLDVAGAVIVRKEIRRGVVPTEVLVPPTTDTLFIEGMTPVSGSPTPKPTNEQCARTGHVNGVNGTCIFCDETNADDSSSTPAWSKETPTQQGWYWYRKSKAYHAVPTFVEDCGNDKFRAVEVYDAKMVWLHDVNVEWWAEPINQPT